MKIFSVHELFLHELQDLYSAESQVIKALPKVMAQVSDERLKSALEDHLQVTYKQVGRLDEISKEFDFKIGGHECQGIKGIIAETEDTLKNISDDETKDVAIIVLAQRVEHYEMAAYAGSEQFARKLGYEKAANLLKETLKEENDADKKLTSLAQGNILVGGLNDTAVNDTVMNA